ncbi:Crp/Fnr family transcriptional regulator [Dokdonia sinensis]|uniref:Crp/Fnr family transcriptional regulator n=1 Tax=Dokdonia sinensis TaxID=2479847 RepID=A0A3M0FYL3_9FLAO|nr:Crp/Fnr family transcriptional regulator [Dokdonia sinensis]RMB56967.1 Crp/Fnr family transcriptional regulator [Dokdonia sinensis]
MSRCENCIIRQLNALKALSKDELKAISDSKTERRIKKGEKIFDENESLDGVFCVRSGASKLSKLQENGKDQIVKIAGSGEVLGKRSLIAEEKANLSATALEDMDVCFIPKKEITAKIYTNPAFTKELLQQLAQDLKNSENSTIDFASKTVTQRLAHTLLHLKSQAGEDRDGFLSLSLTREDLASVIGTATESCIRHIATFKKKGFIETQAKRIKILDLEGLKALE